MKIINKIVLIVNVMFFVFLLGLFFQNNVVNAEEKKYETEYAIYEETEVVANNMIGYGINHINTKAITTAKRFTNISSDLVVDSPQNVNILSVPSAKNIRVVNYTYLDDDGWTKQTLSKMVENFEQNNPGWAVIAGVNGDFYDINGKDMALPYHTNGTTVTNTDVLRAVESKSIGYYNDGSTSPLVIVDKASFTDYHVLTIYDEEDNIIATYNIDKINEEPQNNEVAVYYTYRVNKDSDEDGANDTYDEVSVTVPNENSFIIKSPLRCLPTSEPEIFAKGDISHINEERELNFGEFAIVTSNEEVKSKLSIGTTIRVQKELTGELQNCDQVMGVGSTLIENGVVSEDNSDGMRTDRHPRTCIGVKEDGTLMFFVIDGRQLDNDMYGMTQDEMGAMMAYYGCYQGVNIDGGGSSTFGIRDENGEFVIVNSPSDGHERLNANSLLVVVPELKISTSDYTDTSVKLSYGELAKGITVENIEVTINGITKQMDANEFIFEGLTNDTICEMTYTYDIAYEGITKTITSNKQTFKTGKVPPIVEKANFDVVDNNIVINYKITDVNNLVSIVMLNYKNGVLFIDEMENTGLTISLDNVVNFGMNIDINYQVDSEPNYATRKSHIVTWYPTNLDLSTYTSEEQIIINDLIETVNSILSILTKEEVLLKIDEVRFDISKMDAINQLESLYNKEYLEQNQFKIETIINEAINDVNGSNNIDEVNQILSNVIKEISAIEELERSKIETIYLLEFLLDEDYLDTIKENVETIINKAINDVNVANSVEEIIQIMSSSIEEIEALEEVEQTKINAIKELETLVSGKNFSKKNKEKAETILVNAKEDINECKYVDEINGILVDAKEEINSIKEKGCKSSSFIILIYTFSLTSLGLYLIKRKH